MSSGTRREVALGVVLALVVAFGVGGCAAPEPRLATLLEEPALVPPVAAVPLGTVEEESGNGLIQDRYAMVSAAFAVEMDAEAAVEEWRAAYDEHYSFRQVGSGPKYLAVTSVTEVVVSAADAVEVGPDLADQFDAPPAGTTVVTVVVMARSPSVQGTAGALPDVATLGLTPSEP